MVGSPNHVFFIYDGDNSDADRRRPGTGRFGADREDLRAVLRSRGLPFKGTDFSGRSDYGPFIANGIPSGGLFTGAEGHQDRRGGGDLGWHRRRSSTTRATTRRATPSPTTTSPRSTTNADAIAYATLQYAMSTSDVNGVKGKGNFKLLTTEQITGLSAK